MQVACVHKMTDTEDLKDPLVNLKIARGIYDTAMEKAGDGWLP